MRYFPIRTYGRLPRFLPGQELMTDNNTLSQLEQAPAAFSDKSASPGQPIDLKAIVRASDEKIRQAIESPGAGFFLLEDMVFTYLSPETLRLFGYDSSRLLGKLGPLEIVINDDWERLSSHLKAALDSPDVPQADSFTFTREDGTLVRFNVVAARCDLHEGRCLIGVVYPFQKSTGLGELTSLASISRISASDENLSAKLNLIGAVLASRLETRDLTIWEATDEARCKRQCGHCGDEPCLHLVAKFDGKRMLDEVPDACLPLGRHLIGKAAISHSITIAPGSTFFAVPMPLREQAWAVVAFVRDKSLSEDEKIYLEIVANQIGYLVRSHQIQNALRRSQDLYSKLFAHSRDGIFLHDLNGRILDVNPRALKMLGYGKQEILKLNIADLHPSEALRDSSQAFETIAREGSVSFEIVFKRKDGTTFPAEVSSSLFEIDGRPVIQGIVRDISERRKVETALKHAEHERALILDSIAELVTFQNTELTVVWANKAAGDSVGENPSALVGRKCYEIWHQRETPCENCPVTTAIRKGTRQEAEVTTRDGRVWLIRGNPVRNNDGKIIGAVEVNLEITDRKREELARRQREAELRLHNTIASIFLTIEDDTAYAKSLEAIVEATGSRQGLFGYLNDDGDLVCPSFKTRSLVDGTGEGPAVIPKGSLPTICQGALASKQTIVCNRPAGVPDGHFKVDRFLVVPIVDRDNTIGVLVVANKPTDYVDSDKALLEATATRVAPILKARLAKEREERKRLEAQRQNEKIQASLLNAQKMEAVGRLAGGIAHDFNNILSAIQGFCDLIMMRGDRDSAIYRDLKQIKDASARGNNLTRQLLLFSRGQPLEVTALNINHLVQGISEMVSRLLGENISLTISLEPEVWAIRGDQSQIEQMIMNLLVNARDAMPNGGNITIMTENTFIDQAEAPIDGLKSRKFVCLTVADEGQGIDARTLEHIFDPFYTTKGKSGGTGLGLSVVHGIVERHGGWITVETEINKGTTFKVFLPAEGHVSEESSAEDHNLSEFQGNGECVLVVEDEEPVRQLVERALSENNYRVYEAASSEEALRIFENIRQDLELVVSDVVLSDASGVDLVEKMLKIKPDLRVLLTSGYANGKSQWPKICELGLRFLPKPFELVELLRSVKAALK